MNLLKRYLSDSSAHIKKMSFSEKDKEFKISFYKQPESKVVYASFVFTEVKNFQYLKIDEEDKNCIDLAIGFDSSNKEYYLHTFFAEITFFSPNEPIFKKA